MFLLTTPENMKKCVYILFGGDIHIRQKATPIICIRPVRNELVAYHNYILMYITLGIAYNLSRIKETITWLDVQDYILLRPVTTAYLMRALPIDLGAMLTNLDNLSRHMTVIACSIGCNIDTNRVQVLIATRQLGKTVAAALTNVAASVTIPCGKKRDGVAQSHITVRLASKDLNTVRQLFDHMIKSYRIIPEQQWKPDVCSLSACQISGTNAYDVRTELHGSPNNSSMRGATADKFYLDEGLIDPGVVSTGANLSSGQGAKALEQYLSVHVATMSHEDRRMLITCSAVSAQNELVLYFEQMPANISMSLFSFSCRHCIVKRIPAMCVHVLNRLGCEISALDHLIKARQCNKTSVLSLKHFTQETVGVPCSVNDVLIPLNMIEAICRSFAPLDTPNCIGMIVGVDPGHVKSMVGICILFMMEVNGRYFTNIVTCDEFPSFSENHERTLAFVGLIEAALSVHLPCRLGPKFRTIDLVIERNNTIADTEMYIRAAEAMLRVKIEECRYCVHSNIAIIYDKHETQMSGELTGHAMTKTVVGVSTSEKIKRERTLNFMSAVFSNQIQITDKVAPYNKPRAAMIEKFSSQLRFFASGNTKRCKAGERQDLLDGVFMALSVFKMHYDRSVGSHLSYT